MAKYLDYAGLQYLWAKIKNYVSTQPLGSNVRYDQQTLTTAQQAQARKNIAAGGSNPNLLDNPWFTVNQRNVAVGTNINGNGFVADRWQATGTTGATRNSDGSLTITDTLFHKLPPALELDGKTVTLSVLYADGTTEANTFPWSGTVTKYFTYGRAVVYASAYQINFNSFTKNVKAFKLELGSVSTLANDAPPDYGEELTRCIYSTADPTDTYANNGFGRSNRNLLDNPFFTVNQRSFTSSTGVNNIYSVDRWYIARGTGTISKTNNGITIDGTSASRETTFQQMIDCGDFTGRAVTVSVNDGGTIRQITGTVPARTTSNNIFIRFTLRDGVSAFLYAMSTSSAYAYMLQVQVNAGYTIDIRAVKLELGSVSTLANDAPPDYGEEYRKCRRYFKRLAPWQSGSLAVGRTDNATTANFVIGDEPMAKQTGITATIIGSVNVRAGDNTNHAVTSVSVGTTNGGGIVLVCATTGLTAFASAALVLGNGGRIDISADL